MLKLVMMVCILGATVFQNVAKAQRRGDGPTRGEVNRQTRNHTRPYYPPAPPIYSPPPPPVYHPPIPQPSSSTDYNVIRDAEDGYFRGCVVVQRVDGIYNQLYVNNVFAGNFRDINEDYQLANAIKARLQSRQCQQRSSYEMRLLRSDLINDFARGYSRNCSVRLNVAGWANQVYVNGYFYGNYRAGVEDQKLRSQLVDYVVNGTCEYR